MVGESDTSDAEGRQDVVGSGLVFLVESGVVFAPEVLQQALPHVASLVQGAMQDAIGVKETAAPEPTQPIQQVHTQRDSGQSKPFPCNFCKERFTSRISLNEHRWDCTMQGPKVLKHTVTTIPKKKSAQKKRVHTLPDPELDKRWNLFPCNFCKKRFSSRETLNNHRLIHFIQNKKKCCCATCNQSCGSKNASIPKTTVNISSANKEPGDVRLRSLSDLAEHYSKQMMHLCYVCKRNFNDAFEYKCHLTTHDDLKTYMRATKAKRAKVKVNTEIIVVGESENSRSVATHRASKVPMDTGIVTVEVESDDENPNERELSELYKDHKVKDEIVVGPEVLQRDAFGVRTQNEQTGTLDICSASLSDENMTVNVKDESEEKCKARLSLEAQLVDLDKYENSVGQVEKESELEDLTRTTHNENKSSQNDLESVTLQSRHKLKDKAGKWTEHTENINKNITDITMKEFEEKCRERLILEAALVDTENEVKLKTDGDDSKGKIKPLQDSNVILHTKENTPETVPVKVDSDDKSHNEDTRTKDKLLYAEHDIKDDLVLGPVILSRNVVRKDLELTDPADTSPTSNDKVQITTNEKETVLSETDDEEVFEIVSDNNELNEALARWLGQGSDVEGSR